MGTLRIQGLIDLNQFWPVGSSDADTTKIKLTVNKDSFKFRATEKGAFKTTKVYEGAISKGSTTAEVIKTAKKTGDRTIVVRLQGVDAPELHYKASPLKKSTGVSDAKRKKFNELNEERRQRFGESATVALAHHLAQFADNDGMIKAIFETQVDLPQDAVDTYGRFVGNIVVGKAKDVNVWLVENGWGFPAFYTSMKTNEIQTFLDAWEKGKKKTGRTSTALQKNATKLDWKLVYEKPNADIDFKIGDDKGKALMPKVFRRQVAWMVNTKAGTTPKTNFKTFLAKTPDQLVLRDEYMDNGGALDSTMVYALHDFVSAKNIISKAPDEMIFKEKPGKVVNSNGKELTKW